MNRRDFLKRTIVAASLATSPFTIREAFADNLKFSDLQDAYWRGGCSGYDVIDLCFKVSWDLSIHIGLKVRHRTPAFLIEVVRSPSDSAFSNGSHTNSKSQNRTRPGHYMSNLQTHDVRVWGISKEVILLLTLVMGCMTCPQPSIRPKRKNYGNIDDDLMEDLTFTQLCDVQEYIESIASEEALFHLAKSGKIVKLPLLYTSELDQYNWTTGCRDTLKGLASIPCNYGSTNEEWCIGKIGPIFPRSMASISYEQQGAVISAYRAAHLVVDKFKSANVPIAASKVSMQQIFPEVGECFPLHTQNPTTIGDKVKNSPDGRYAFFLWTTVTCCKYENDIANCD